MGDSLGFFNIHFVEKYQNIEGMTLWRIFSKTKSLNAKKTEREDPLASPGIVCYIRTLKTLHPNFENVTSELSKRYILSLKRYIRTLETLYPNFENVISEL